jgi:hypothetical protein
MNVFVLSTGRCGSQTFARACRHIVNYTAAHEGQSTGLLKVKRPYRLLDYPENHIEVDNRLSWFLGDLEKTYGSEAFYVHLIRNREEVAQSLCNRGEESILFFFAWGVLQHYRRAQNLNAEERYQIGLQYWDTVNNNIGLFLKDKPRKLEMWLHEIKSPFRKFWQEIGAQGDLEAALSEWDMRYNATKKGRAFGWAPCIDPWTQRVRLTIENIKSLIPAGSTFILVDEEQLGTGENVAGSRALPFLEADGLYWGPPPDDATAISELERLRRSGAGFVVFSWPAFWWLNYYAGLSRHLRSQFRCLAENEHLVMFDLRNNRGENVAG